MDFIYYTDAIYVRLTFFSIVMNNCQFIFKNQETFLAFLKR